MSTDRGIQLQVDFRDRPAAALLEELAAKVADPTPVMRSIGETVRTSIARNFASGGRPLAWAQSRRAKDEGGQTLSDKARLRRSFTVAAGPDFAAVGTNVVYAAVHHFGARQGSFGMVSAKVREHVRQLASGKKVTVPAHTRRQQLPWGDIPARPFMLVQMEDWSRIADDLKRYLAGV